MLKKGYEVLDGSISIIIGFDNVLRDENALPDFEFNLRLLLVA